MSTATMHAFTDPLKALAAARFWALRAAPYLTQAILSMVPREVPLGTLSQMGGSNKGTMAMNDSGILFYEREAPLRWTTPACGAVLIHEAMHWLRKHGARRLAIKAEHRMHWQFAVDFEINDDLHAMKLPLPDGGGLHPKQEGLAEGQLAEVYYQQLLQKHPPKEPLLSLVCGCGGGSAAGIRLDCEPSADAEDPAIRAQVEVDLMRVQVAEAIKDHTQKHGIGSCPAGLQRWADDITKPAKVPWNEKLRRLARARLSFRSGGSRATYAVKARRQAGLGYGFGSPQMTARVEQKAEVVLAIDTSGSMGKEELTRALIEAHAVMQSLGHPVRFMACDADVHENKMLRTLQDLINALKGGGSTDFRPVFEQLQTTKPKPDLLIFITDGGGYAPAHPPKGINVIWVLVGKHRCKPMLPGGGSIAWGDMLEIED